MSEPPQPFNVDSPAFGNQLVRIDRLSVEGFRNLRQVRLDLNPRFNCFTGSNAQGKTNLLEAVALLADLRSFRAGRTEDWVVEGGERAHIKGRARAGELDYAVSLSIGRGTRRLVVNDKPVRRHKDYLGQLPSVAFSPEDVRLAKGSPDARRRFLDRALSLVRPGYWDLALEYKQVLKRRNALLKARKAHGELFDLYSEKLAECGAAIDQARASMTADLQRLSRQAVAAVSENSEVLELSYLSSPPDETQALFGDSSSVEGAETSPDRVAALTQALQRKAPHDRERGYTSVGPHTADLGIRLDGRLAQTSASQGQHRTLALALKVAEVEIVHAARGVFPILLVDDLSSELDAGRRARLFDYLTRSGGQVLLTSTDPEIGAGLAPYGLAAFTVRAGLIEPSTTNPVSGDPS